MKKLILKLINIGNNPELDQDTSYKIRVINFLSVIGIAIGFISLFYSIGSSWPRYAVLNFAIITPLQVLPIIFNAYGKHYLARLYLILLDNISVIFTVVLFGLEAHYQYWLIVITVMPLLIFRKEVGIFKWFLSVSPILCWLYLEWHHAVFNPIFRIEVASFFYIRLVNDFITFITVFTMFAMLIRESERQLTQTIKLSKVNANLKQYSHTVSHDLKAPLINISSFVDLIENYHGQDFNEELSDLFTMIKESSLKMKRLISSILEYSKAGESDVKYSSFSLSKLIDGIVELVDIPESIRLYYETGLPVIYGSYIQLEQVLTNLITNAIKYHDKENGLIRIKVVDHIDEFLKIEVIDDGPGVKEKYQTKIFELFGSANEVSRNDSTGVGLSIVSKLVELNQGEIGIESEYGKGSKFWFTWPLDASKLKKQAIPSYS